MFDTPVDRTEQRLDHPQFGQIPPPRTLAQVPWLTLNPIRLMNDNRSLAGVNLGRMWSEQERLSGWIAQLLDWLVAGRIAPHIDRVFPFTEAGAAHQRLEQRRNVGKVLLTPDGTEPAA